MSDSDQDKLYKNITKLSNFINLVINKTINIINDKLLSNANDFTSLISSDDNDSKKIENLKKKHSLWNEIIMNYTTFMMCFNNSLSNDQSMSYVRKVLKISSDEKYINKFVKSLNGFIENITSIIVNLDYFAKNFDLIVSEGKSIKNLSDVVNLIKQTLTTIEGHSKKLSKKGSCEMTKFILGSCDTEVYSLIIGGNDVMVSGNHVTDYIKQQYILYQLYNDDLKNISEKEKNIYYDKFKVNKYDEMINYNACDIYNHVVKNSGMLNNLYHQFNKMSDDDLTLLIDYNSKRFNVKSIDKPKINWDGNAIIESIENLLSSIENIMNTITKYDINKLIKDVKTTFLSLKNEEKINIDYDLLKSVDHDSRYKSKLNIMNKINEIRKLLTKKIQCPNVSFSMRQTNPIKHMKEILEIETILMPTLKQNEIYYDDLSVKLNELSNDYLTLIDPGNNITCIKRPSLYLTSGLIVCINNITNNDEKNDEIIKYINDKLQINCLNFYDNELNLDYITKIIMKLV